MHTNTSRAMTAFSDFPAPADHPLHPAAEQIHAYLEAYARAFGVVERIRFDTAVEHVRSGWTVDGEPFDAVVVASGRFRKPRMPRVVERFAGELIHAYDYPGRRGVPGPAHPGVRQRDQRPRDRLRPGAVHAGRSPPSASRAT
jgi:cation diffusion facilitator CzcD-associated flavoprotein CzcO